MRAESAVPALVSLFGTERGNCSFVTIMGLDSSRSPPTHAEDTSPPYAGRRCYRLFHGDPGHDGGERGAGADAGVVECGRGELTVDRGFVCAGVCGAAAGGRGDHGSVRGAADVYAGACVFYAVVGALRGGADGGVFDWGGGCAGAGGGDAASGVIGGAAACDSGCGEAFQGTGDVGGVGVVGAGGGAGVWGDSDSTARVAVDFLDQPAGGAGGDLFCVDVDAGTEAGASAGFQSSGEWFWVCGAGVAVVCVH